MEPELLVFISLLIVCMILPLRTRISTIVTSTIGFIFTCVVVGGHDTPNYNVYIIWGILVVFTGIHYYIHEVTPVNSWLMTKKEFKKITKWFQE